MRPQHASFLALACVQVCVLTLAPSTQAREIGIDERVQAQTAIERFYWSLRDWPNDNSTPKPALDEVISQDEIRGRVMDSLQRETALRERWGMSFGTAEVQAEIDRMAQDSRKPEDLERLWAALHRDPLLIAESFARPRLVDREIRARYARDPAIHAETRIRAETGVERLRALESPADLDAQYAEVTWTRATTDEHEPTAGVVPLAPEDWDALWARLALPGEASIPAGRLTPLEETDDAFVVVQVLDQHDTTLRTVTVSWSKVPFETWWGVERAAFGADAATDDASYSLDAASLATCDFLWNSISQIAAPSPRHSHSAVWTGSEMIVWGGRPSAPTTDVNTGGRYDPLTDSWTATSTGTGVPSARSFHTAVWTGTEMIVWGGQFAAAGSELNTGGRYDPATDTWTPTSLGSGVLTPRSGHTAVWVGDEMIVWGGSAPGVPTGDPGARYLPGSDRWIPLTSPSLLRRSDHDAVWTGRYMLVWGGSGYLRIGEAYDPSFRSWSYLADPPAPLDTSHIFGSTAVWTGSEMIVWGGNTSGTTGQVNHGGRYNPLNDSWVLTSTGTGVPDRREDHTAVWTGTEMIVWGGELLFGPTYDTGGRYDPLTDTWIPTSVGAGVPSARRAHTAVWTGSEMIVWGGTSAGAGRSDGGRYAQELCDDGDACTTPDRCEDGVCIGGPPRDCNDGNTCTDDPCDSTIGCANTSNGTCTGEPKGQGYWKSLCRGPHASEFLTQFDVDCVNDSCTFATIETVDQLCARMSPDPHHDMCEKAEAQLLALLLNECRTRVSDSTSIETDCADGGATSTTVGASIAEADALLCDSTRTDAECTLANCLSEEINSGEALGINTLRVRLEAGGVRLTWDPPYSPTQRPTRYVLSRANLRDGTLTPIAETTDLEFLDAEVNPEDHGYDVRAVW